jgi:hypothetical protein
VSTFLVLREMDPAMTEGEREGLNSRVIVTLALHPGVHWLRSYVVDVPGRFESVCVYEGPDSGAVAYRSDYCRVPYREIRQVSESLPAAYGVARQPPSSHSFFVVKRQFPIGISDEDLEAAVFRSADCLRAFNGVRWERSFWDPARSLSHCVYRAPSKAIIAEHAALARIPANNIDEAVEAHPSQWAEMFESFGVPKYWDA